MTRSMISRFQYGNSGWPSAFSPEAELVIESPKRERELITLARHQIETQKAVGREVIKSNLAGAQIIAAEIEQQTQALGESIDRLGDRIGDSISTAANQISSAIDILGNRLCIELSEIKWQLAQQNQTLDKILDVLYKSRNNEARQLVQQGVRHYLNNEYNEAEERFNLALKFDTTDYQVLMNLGYIELHKGNASQSITFFKKAVTLPEKLDSYSKARALWATARVFYVEKDYSNSLSFAEQAFYYDDKNDVDALYKMCVYSALAGKSFYSLEQIKKIINMRPSYFSKVATDPDLNVIRQDILNLLSKLASESYNQASDYFTRFSDSLNKAIKEISSYNTEDLSRKVKNHLNKANSCLRQKSYSDIIKCINNLFKLNEVGDKLRMLAPMYKKETSAIADVESKKNQHENLAQNKVPGSIEPLFFHLIGLITLYFGPYIAIVIQSTGERWWDNSGLITMLFWPLFFLLSFLPTKLDELGLAIRSGTFIGILIGGVIWFILWLCVNQINERNNVLRKKIDTSKTDYNIAEETLRDWKNKINNIRKYIENQFNEISWEP